MRLARSSVSALSGSALSSLVCAATVCSLLAVSSCRTSDATSSLSSRVGTARASEQTTSPASIRLARVNNGMGLLPSALEADVLAEINLLRRDPVAYANIVRGWEANYRGNVLLVPGQNKAIKTVEGAAALREAIAVLESTSSSQTMGWLDGLSRAAADHVRVQGATRTIGHRGEDGSNSLQRISRHGVSRGRSAEVIDYGWDNARDIVIDLLVDDGIADRGHRRALLDPLYANAGVSCGGHARYGVMCVVEMAERFDAFPAGESSDDGLVADATFASNTAANTAAGARP